VRDVTWGPSTGPGEGRRGGRDATRRDLARVDTAWRARKSKFPQGLCPTRAKTRIFMSPLRCGEHRGNRGGLGDVTRLDVATQSDVTWQRGDVAVRLLRSTCKSERLKNVWTLEMLKKERSTCLLPSSTSVLCLLPNHWKMSEDQGHTQVSLCPCVPPRIEIEYEWRDKQYK
jgi:hypothetical protein